MSDENSGLGMLAIGCGLGALLLLGAGFLFVGTTSVSPAGPGGVSAAVPTAMERGFRIKGGELLPAADGQQKFIVEVELTQGWTLTQFRLDSMKVIADAMDYPVALVGPLPQVPIEQSFRLTFQSSHPAPTESDPAPVFQLDVNSKANSGFFGSKAQSDSSCLLEMIGARLVPK